MAPKWPPPTSSRPITLADAMDYHERHKHTPMSIENIKSFYFTAQHLIDLITNNGADGVRFYLGRTATNQPTLIAAAQVDGDVKETGMVENPPVCPPWCPVTDPLNPV